MGVSRSDTGVFANRQSGLPGLCPEPNRYLSGRPSELRDVLSGHDRPIDTTRELRRGDAIYDFAFGQIGVQQRLRGAIERVYEQELESFTRYAAGDVAILFLGFAAATDKFDAIKATLNCRVAFEDQLHNRSPIRQLDFLQPAARVERPALLFAKTS